MQETRVNLKHLLKDLRDSYALPIEEAIVVELVANALDSRATKIDFFLKPGERKITVCDDGIGMNKRQLYEYHDIAATTKIKGRGIGFAGIGAKLSLLVAKSIITETKSIDEKIPLATRWYLLDEKRAPWEFISPRKKFLKKQGTAVTIELLDSKSPLFSPKFVSETIKKHFLPLLDRRFFHSIYKYIYKKRINFFVNKKKVDSEIPKGVEFFRDFKVFLGKKQKKLIGFGYLAKSKKTILPEFSGLAISCYGKIIKRGWEWLGILPKSVFQIYGIVEVPAFSEILTTGKNDFLKDASSLKKYYRWRKAIQEAILPILSEFGEERMFFESEKRQLKFLEKEMAKILRRLLVDFPELIPLVGLKRIAKREDLISKTETPQVAIIPAIAEKKLTKKEIENFLEKKLRKRGDLKKKKRTSGLTIAFEKSPEKNLARIVKNVILINTSHPTYQKAKKENLEQYHIPFCVALTLSKFLEESRSPQDFINEFFTCWAKFE